MPMQNGLLNKASLNMQAIFLTHIYMYNVVSLTVLGLKEKLSFRSNLQIYHEHFLLFRPPQSRKYRVIWCCFCHISLSHPSSFALHNLLMARCIFSKWINESLNFQKQTPYLIFCVLLLKRSHTHQFLWHPGVFIIFLNNWIYPSLIALSKIYRNLILLGQNKLPLWPLG